MATYDAKKQKNMTACPGNYSISQQVLEDIAKYVCYEEDDIILHAVSRQEVLDWFQTDRTAVLKEDAQGRLRLQLAISLPYQIRMPDKVLGLQKKIHDAIYEMTEISLDTIDIFVLDLNMA